MVAPWYTWVEYCESGLAVHQECVCVCAMASAGPPVRDCVSVVMPVHNAGLYLKTAVDSMLQQDLDDNTQLEVVLVDDGSQDDSLSTCREYERNHNNVKVVSLQKNQGIVAALNTGVKVASGTFIARMDADDWSAPTRLRKQLDYLRGHPDVGVLGCAVEVFQQQVPALHNATKAEHKTPDASLQTDPIVTASPDLLRPIVLPTHPAMVHWSMFFYCPLAHPTIVARRQVFQRFPYVASAYLHAEDYYLWMRMLLGGHEQSSLCGTEPSQTPRIVRMANLPDKLLRLRKHGKRATYHQSQRESSWGVVGAALRTLGVPASDKTKQIELSSERLAEILHKPSVCQTVDELAVAMNAVELLLARVQDAGFTADGMAAVWQDAVNRMGEIAMLAARIDTLGAMGLLQRWTSKQMEIPRTSQDKGGKKQAADSSPPADTPSSSVDALD